MDESTEYGQDRDRLGQRPEKEVEGVDYNDPLTILIGFEESDEWLFDYI